MSPAGIPLFYGADDPKTALAEVARADEREFFTGGKFVTTEPVTVFNLADVPSVPSIFDSVLDGVQGKLRFLNELVDELREPIKPHRSNLDYVTPAAPALTAVTPGRRAQHQRGNADCLWTRPGNWPATRTSPRWPSPWACSTRTARLSGCTDDDRTIWPTKDLVS